MKECTMKGSDIIAQRTHNSGEQVDDAQKRTSRDPEVIPPRKPDNPTVVPPKEPPTKEPQKPEVQPVPEPPVHYPDKPEITQPGHG
jgi:hypothetical protein